MAPYASKAQAAYFNIHKNELEKQGVDVDEWNKSSKGKSLPEHVRKPETKSAPKKTQRIRHTSRAR